MTHRVAVLGDGTMGTALADAVGSGNRGCVLWSPDVELVRAVNERHRNPRHFSEHVLAHSLSATTIIEEAVASAQLVIVAVGSDLFRGIARSISAFVAPELVLLSATKGLEPQTNKRMSELLKEETRAEVVGAISGPNVTPDIIARRPTAIVVASKSNSALALAAELIELPTLRVFGSSDLAGVEFTGALKNIVVIAAGVAAGLGLGDNARASLVTMGLAEIQRIGTSLGGRPDTFMGLAGVGDIFLSSTSVYSRNHMVGVELGKGAKVDSIVDELRRLNETAEGINTIRTCRILAVERGVRMPLAECMHGILFEGLQPRTELERLLCDPDATKCLAAE
jgi:glycerol-3-phosphate dehydrogenase (NAD(P)+)